MRLPRPQPRPHHDRLAHRHRDPRSQRPRHVALFSTCSKVPCCTWPPTAPSWLFIGFTLFAPAVALAVRFFTHVRALQRLATPSNPSSTTQRFLPACAGYFQPRHQAASWVPDGDADIGPGSTGQLRLHSPPWPRELGLTGMAAILILYLILIQRGCAQPDGARPSSVSFWPPV